jgi:transcriptional regulator with XRE-family HTH domain
MVLPPSPRGTRTYIGGVDLSAEVRAYLMSRRARITPAQAGIVSDGDDRRVSGLRREEVATLAGMSTDYYKRLERGNLRGASEAVLEALAQALRLDEAERAHLANLAKCANQTLRSRSRAMGRARLDSTVADLLDKLSVPAMARNGLLDILGANDMGRELFSVVFGGTIAAPNYARHMFLDPRARSFWLDWEPTARSIAAILRTQFGRFPDDRALQALISELSADGDDFRRIWALHEVEFHRNGRGRVRHPVLGEMALTVHSLEVVADDGPVAIDTFSVEPTSYSAAASPLLDSIGV